ncbi:MAG: copper homeostasis protein CutC [Calditrichaeota bacterium]|nr:MAG: copper homeostasis protein CutC [Calditrichota bacterium]
MAATRRIPLEICINSSNLIAVHDSVQAAFIGGAERIELCSHMALQGLTPPVEHIQAARQVFGRPGLLVMIRPRTGDFAYTKQEIETMCRDIEAAASVGADGVVVGAVKGGKLDLPAFERLSAAAQRHELAVTFHRAFDALEKPVDAVAILSEWGIQRILTSGTPWGSDSSAMQGIEQLQKICVAAAGKVEIVIGGGINHANVRSVLDQIGSVSASISIHAYSAVLTDGMTDALKVRALSDEINQFGQLNNTIL